MSPILYVLILMISMSCSRSVSRVNSSTQIDLSGRWNDTDSKLVAEEMISDVLSRPWRENFVTKNNERPVVIVGMITNKSHEHIEEDIFIKDLQKAFINTGTVRVVENDAFRDKLRAERADMSEFASESTQATWGQELGADFMMNGTINSQVDQYKREKLVNYKVNLWLTNTETNEKVWLGDKEIKKFIKN